MFDVNIYIRCPKVCQKVTQQVFHLCFYGIEMNLTKTRNAVAVSDYLAIMKTAVNLILSHKYRRLRRDLILYLSYLISRFVK